MNEVTRRAIDRTTVAGDRIRWSDDGLTFGNGRLACWSAGGGEVKVQSRDPDLSRRVRRWQGFRIVGRQASGGYLRQYLGRATMARVAALVVMLLTRSQEADLVVQTTA